MATWLAATRRHAEVVDLDDPTALDVSIVGTKAANLARARAAGLPVLGGFVIPVEVADAVRRSTALSAAVMDAYGALCDGGRRTVVVRSSSPSEDTGTSSQAGRFTSVVDVRGGDAFTAAVAAVVASGGGEPMAVLVQPHLDPAVAGVAFGLDPVSGRGDRLTVAAVRGGPQALVGGAVAGDRYELGRRGRLHGAHHVDGATELTYRHRRRLAGMAARASAVFGGPQDIEWAITDAGALVLLQSRPVTTTAAPAIGPPYGAGPLAETFPAPLSRLEQDLWLAPLRVALAEVAVLTGRASRRAVARRDVVVAPGGRASIDLELFGDARPAGLVAAVDPRPRIRRLRAAWRVGRLAAAIDALAADVVADADGALEGVPDLRTLTDDELVRVIERSFDALVALHGHEVLIGALGGEEGGPTAAEVALHGLAKGRAAGLGPAALRPRHPEVLALSAPHIGVAAPLPSDTPVVRSLTVGHLGGREALRLRARWVHELTVRVALEVGSRLAARGVLATSLDVRHLGRNDLADALAGAPVGLSRVEEGPPLPSVFRLTEDGTPVAVSSGGGAGVGAGGGRRAGPVHLGDDPPPGSVLVVDVLDPALAVWLPRLAGLVAETGSPLSHLAILAREHGVATVVGVGNARGRWTVGQVVVVDGTNGDVMALGEAEVAP